MIRWLVPALVAMLPPAPAGPRPNGGASRPATLGGFGGQVAYDWTRTSQGVLVGHHGGRTLILSKAANGRVLQTVAFDACGPRATVSPMSLVTDASGRTGAIVPTPCLPSAEAVHRMAGCRSNPLDIDVVRLGMDAASAWVSRRGGPLCVATRRGPLCVATRR